MCNSRTIWDHVKCNTARSLDVMYTRQCIYYKWMYVCMYVCTYVLIGVLMIDTFMSDNLQINHTNDALLLHCSVMKIDLC